MLLRLILANSLAWAGISARPRGGGQPRVVRHGDRHVHRVQASMVAGDRGMLLTTPLSMLEPAALPVGFFLSYASPPAPPSATALVPGLTTLALP